MPKAGAQAASLLSASLILTSCWGCLPGTLTPPSRGREGGTRAASFYARDRTLCSVSKAAPCSAQAVTCSLPVPFMTWETEAQARARSSLAVSVKAFSWAGQQHRGQGS